MMTLCEAEKNYLVYLHAVHIPKKQYMKYQRALQDILAFYGSDLPLVRFDNSLVLEYVKENDPFDCNPIHEERGNVYCVFINWLMKNKLIPAWSHVPVD